MQGTIAQVNPYKSLKTNMLINKQEPLGIQGNANPSPSEGRGQGFESLRVRQIAILDCRKKSSGRSGIGADNFSGM
jgi:hypothetical protein